MLNIRRALSLAVATVAVVAAGMNRQLDAQGADSAAPAPPRPITVTATGVISGRVVASATGTPLRGAEVRLRAAAGRDDRLVTADEAGRFAFRDLTPGQWSVRASKAGYLTQQFGQDHPFEAPVAIELRDGQRTTADLALARGGAIGGRVVDGAGEPLPGVTVRVMRTRMMRGARRLASVGAADVTDDQGVFRAYGLPSGEYYVAAALRTPEDTSVRALADMPTYYPDTRSIGQAQRVAVAAGGDAAIVITANPLVTGARLSGRVFSAGGTPAVKAAVHLYHADDLAFGTGTAGILAGTDGTGRFTVPNVPPGNYVLDATFMAGNGPADREQAVLSLTVGGEDIEGVTVTMKRSVTVLGTIAADTGASLPDRFAFGVSALGAETMGGMHIEGAGPRGTFAIPALLGRLTLAVTTLPEGWFVKSIELDGDDVTDTIVDLGRYGRTVNARILVSDRGAEVNGLVAAAGRPRPAAVVIFPEDPQRWTYPSRFVRATRADREGRFRVAGLPPDARYRAVALTFLEEDAYQDPEFLARLQGAGEGFSLGEGEKKTLRLTPAER